MPPDADARVGIAVIRAWVEAGEADEGEKALRARVITVEHGDPDSEQASTASGVRDVMDLVREFLTGLTEGDDGTARRD